MALVILVLIVGGPLAFWGYQAQKKGISIGEAIRQNLGGNKEKEEEAKLKAPDFMENNFLKKSDIGFKFEDQPQISNLAIADLDGDDLLDVLVCDLKSNTISWIRQNPEGQYVEEVLASEIIAPAHIEVNDFDEDGDQDLLVAILGMLFPNNDKIGAVVIFENDGNNKFRKRIIAENIARVTDVSAGDFDGDGDKDLAVAQFGYDDGETRWIENLGNWTFKSHILQSRSGPINVEITDIDDDSDLDIVSLVSQEWEEIYCFVNDGKGNFQSRLLWGSTNDDFGSSGIIMADINLDGKEDILYTNGDAFDYIPPMPRPWHGVQWFENKGDFKFELHRICTFPGAFSARACDIDHDNDMDIFVVSGFNNWDKPDAESLVWLENDGSNGFRKHTLATTPTHLITMELGDFNKDGHMDLVTGGMYVYPPFEKMARIILWENNGGLISE